MLNDGDAAFRKALVCATLVALGVASGFTACKKSETSDVSKARPRLPRLPSLPRRSLPRNRRSTPRCSRPPRPSSIASTRAPSASHRRAAPKPTPGKKVWIISPGQIGESASIPTNAVKEAGELLG